MKRTFAFIMFLTLVWTTTFWATVSYLDSQPRWYGLHEDDTVELRNFD